MIPRLILYLVLSSFSLWVVTTTEESVSIDEASNQRHSKRDVDAGKIDVHALQTTVNDHRTMINNSINATLLANAVRSDMRRELPSVTNWRDMVDLICISILLIFIVRYLLSHKGCGIGARFMSMMGRQLAGHIHPKESEKESFPSEKKATLATARDHYQEGRVSNHVAMHRQAPLRPIRTISDRVPYNEGYLSD
jgi:hypothetical protein